MENVSSGTHRGPPPRIIIKPEALAREKAERKGKSDGKKASSKDVEEQRRRWRDAYYKGAASKRLAAKRPDARERKRVAARAYYYANKGALLQRQKERDTRRRSKQKAVRHKSLPAGNGAAPPVRNTGNKTDALIYLNKSISCISSRDWEGADLFARLAKRVLQGKE